MGPLHAIFNFFMFWINIRVKYDRLKANERLRDVSTTLGVQSIVQTLICAVLTGLLLWAAIFLIGAMDGDAALLFIFIIVGAAACIIGAVMTLIQGVFGGLLYMIYQFRLNKRPIRWVALGVWIAAIVGLVLFIALFVFNNNL